VNPAADPIAVALLVAGALEELGVADLLDRALHQSP